MKQILLPILISVCCCSYASGQLIIDKNSLPNIGDTLRTCTDVMPNKSYKMSAAGTNQTWNFEGLKQTTTNVIAILKVAAGSSANLFPTATQIEKTIPTVAGANGAENYIKVTTKTYERVGTGGGGNATNPLLNGIIRYNPSSVERRIPMKFLDNNLSKSSLSVGFKASTLPDSLLAALGPLASSVDSIRVRITYDRIELVDGSGTIKIPGGDYNVLREKRTQYSDTRLDIKTGFLGWQDITGVLTGGAGGGGGFAAQLGKDTATTYAFYSNVAKEIIAVFTVSNADNSVITRANFKFNKIILANSELDLVIPTIKAFPNPAIDEVTFEFNNLEASNYTLKIYNILGALVAKESFFGTSTKLIRMDVSRFKKGTYLYALSDTRGRILASKRLIVVKP
jgi:hypothetical protein